MTPDEKYISGNREKLRQPIQIKFSGKQKVFSEPFTAFLKATLNCKHFGKKDESHSGCLFEIRVCEIRAYVNVKRVMFQYILGQSTC